MANMFVVTAGLFDTVVYLPLYLRLRLEIKYRLHYSIFALLFAFLLWRENAMLLERPNGSEQQLGIHHTFISGLFVIIIW